ncbi:50S ribosomal protein L11 methyltransferase [Phenylobacterium immobile]|uniref:50S ribosomal protein L11 methyltransferase n=1 Tax=Phenylobacterium immobile TaxID=21 RepID=UPI000A9232C6|nr:50S ribosomal protein L11 methyltransferase [Phenylobacterium immobile]
MGGPPPPAKPRPSDATIVASRLKQAASSWTEVPSQQELNEMLRLLGRWRSRLLARTFVAHQGARIWSGPFAGMDYVSEATEGALIPRLIGTYESELHPHIAAFAAQGVDCVIDVGCAEGYYAVGLARMMPAAQIYAYDIDPKARVACEGLAAKNDVSARVHVGGEFAPDGFEAFAGRSVLVMVDAEGAEDVILQPDLSPALAGMRIIVETHDLYNAGVMDRLIQRFAATHDILRVDQQPKTFDPPAWLGDLAHLDQLLAVWEWRARPTPWLVMTPRSGSSAA